MSIVIDIDYTKLEDCEKYAELSAIYGILIKLGVDEVTVVPEDDKNVFSKTFQLIENDDGSIAFKVLDRQQVDSVDLEQLELFEENE